MSLCATAWASETPDKPQRYLCVNRPDLTIPIENILFTAPTGLRLELFQDDGRHYIAKVSTTEHGERLVAFPKIERGMSTAWVTKEKLLIFGQPTRSVASRLSLKQGEELEIVEETDSDFVVLLERHGYKAPVAIPKETKGVVVAERRPLPASAPAEEASAPRPPPSPARPAAPAPSPQPPAEGVRPAAPPTPPSLEKPKPSPMPVAKPPSLPAPAAEVTAQVETPKPVPPEPKPTVPHSETGLPVARPPTPPPAGPPPAEVATPAPQPVATPTAAVTTAIEPVPEKPAPTAAPAPIPERPEPAPAAEEKPAPAATAPTEAPPVPGPPEPAPTPEPSEPVPAPEPKPAPAAPVGAPEAAPAPPAPAAPTKPEPAPAAQSKSEEPRAPGPRMPAVLRLSAFLERHMMVSEILLAVVIVEAILIVRLQKQKKLEAASLAVQTFDSLGQAVATDPFRAMAQESGDFSGSLEGFAVTDLVHFLNTAKESGVLMIKNEADSIVGQMYFREGEVIDAFYGEERGKEAILAAAKGKNAFFTFNRKPMAGKHRTIRQSTASLLVSAAQEMPPSEKPSKT